MPAEYIIREDFDINFVQIPKTALKDRVLSLKAKGLYCYLFSLPANWKVYKTELVNHFSDGKDSLNAAFKELEYSGYLEAKTIREPGTNRFVGTSLLLRVDPLRVSRGGFPVNGFPVSGESATNNTNSKDIQETNKSISNEIDSKTLFPEEDKAKKGARFKKPSKDEIREYFKLLKEVDNTEAFYDCYESNGWKVGGNKMSDWQATIRKWIRRNKENSKKDTLPDLIII